MSPRFLPRLAVASAALVGSLALLAFSAPAGASGKATTVTAAETDFHIALSKTTFTAGPYVFVIKNKGQTTHGFTITGPGLKNATTPNINPGQQTRLKVTFKKGKYDIFCPVPGHKEMGMNVNLTVEAAHPSSIPTTSSLGTLKG